MKNRKHFITLLFIFVISVMLSFIINNFNVFSINKMEDIELSSVETKGIKYKDGYLIPDGKDKTIKINYTGFINKLVVNYESLETFDIDIKSNGNYGEAFDKRLNKAVTKISSDVNNLTIDLSKGNNFTIKSITIDNKISMNNYLTLYIFVSISLIYVIYSYCKNDLFEGKIEKLFLTLAISIGSLFILLQPYTTSYSWDDQIHFKNIYKVFELDGKIEWTNSSNVMKENVPFTYFVDTEEERKIEDDFLNKNDETVVSEDKTSPLITYNETGYVIPGLVYKICSILGISFTIKIILTKFSILLFYSLVMYYAIKILPRGKRIMTIFGLFPSILFLATQFSYDSPIIAMMSLFTAEYLSILETKKKIDLKQSIILLSTVILSSFIKGIYIPLILLILFIPKEKFNNSKQMKYLKIGTFVLFVLMMSTFVLPAVTDPANIGDFRGGDTSSSAQLKYIINHPFNYLETLNNTFVKYFFGKFLGTQTLYSFGYIETRKYDNIYYIVYTLFIYTVATDSYSKYKDKKHIKIVNIVLILGIMLLIWTALYLAFTPVGESTINGVQSRYFIPLIIPFFLISCSNGKIKNEYNLKKYDSFILTIMTATLLITLYSSYILKFCL